MKKYLFTIVLAGSTCLSPALADTPTVNLQAAVQPQNTNVKGKYLLDKEKQEIIRNGKVVESTTGPASTGLIYNFVGAGWVEVKFIEEGKSFDLKLTQDDTVFHLRSLKGELEDDTLLLLRNDYRGVIFQRTMEDEDEEGEILVRTTLYLKPIQ